LTEPQLSVAISGRSCSGAARSSGVMPIAPPVDRSLVINQEKDLEQTHICIGGPGISQASPLRYASYVLNTALGGGMSSRLFQEVRERRGRVYSIYSFMSSFIDCGYLGIYAGTNPEWVDEVIEVTNDQICAQRASLDRINSYFNSVTNLVGKFVQVGPDGSRSEGKLYILKPGKVRFEYDPPSPIELIADGSSVAVRDRTLATQDIYPLSQTPLRFLLTEKINLLRDANVVGVYQDELFVSVAIEEKHPMTGTHRLLIMFGAQDFQLKQWTVTDQQGYDTTVAVYNLDASQKPDPRLFRINYERMLQ